MHLAITCSTRSTRGGGGGRGGRRGAASGGSKLGSLVTSGVTRRHSRVYFVDCKGIFTPILRTWVRKSTLLLQNRGHAEVLKKTPSSAKYVTKVPHPRDALLSEILLRILFLSPFYTSRNFAGNVLATNGDGGQ